MLGREGDGGDVAIIKKSGDETKPLFANVMAFHCLSNGQAGLSRKKATTKKRQTTARLGGRGEKEW
jgi:hypothetical protein